MKILWTFVAWQQYIDWQHSDVNAVAKINDFIEDIRRNPAGKGIGKPERLTGLLAGWSSRRISHEHRLVYRVQGAREEQTIEIIHCKGHYGQIATR